jgi:hypothetical protein
MNTAVRASKRALEKEAAPWRQLEFFPTPPWATRALTEDVLPGLSARSVWEPCAGLSHMSDVLAERFAEVRASDVYSYPSAEGGDARRYGVESFDFLDESAVAEEPLYDWVITNPPFSKAADMLPIALSKARLGVAFLLRMQWLEGATRYFRVYDRMGPTFVAPFCERVPMCGGGWDVEGSSATMYAWFVWLNGADWQFSRAGELPLRLIPPGRAALLSRGSDARNFGRRYVPGWIAPSKLKTGSRHQSEMEV